MTRVHIDFEISDKNKAAIDYWLTKYPADKRRSAVVAALLMVQEQNRGWLSEASMNAVADYLQIAPIEVYEVATFYDMFELKPIGEHKITICTNISCMLAGSEKIVACVEEKLGIKMGETTEDGKFTLRESECLAACGNAPMCQVDDKSYHENLSIESMTALLDRLAKEGASHEA
jgi:NADH-quinone oxidoreductase subunit E